jgi:UDP-glucose 4-epimerase
VAGTIEAMENEKALYEVFNIGSRFEITVNDLAEKIRDIIGSKSKIVHVPYEEVFGPHFDDIQHRVPDITKAKELLGFEAKIDLDTGLKRTIEWARAHYVSAGNI